MYGRSDNKNIVIGQGEILFIPEQTKRSAYNLNHEPHQKITILFHAVGQCLEDISFLRQERFLHLTVRDVRFFRQRFESLYYESNGEKSYKHTICNGILIEIIGVIARELSLMTLSPMKLKYAQDIQTYIMKNYREPINIRTLAKLINKSINYTISIFKEIYGVTPIQYVHQLRIAEASYLLLHTDMAIINISEFLGYYDSAYFSKTFKKIMDCTPKQYRITMNL
ncbi:helix-turn-helix transcriptional regulator [Gracilibacillus alcaliphilus]|uniref:helix-turn-helix transcriptional regulator n=1 Tax=Gracilibacillus alcaliphilus TaxID=1401441 RepID=UPI00195A59A1|nr:AraC family transcriptional regulator [Gracilibacillus alcaliphilus]MBM7675650.1 AraC-like DNA-binding protein [Gracilibacillus alcaliphilus]